MSEAEAGRSADPRAVFVVHGRNEELRLATFEFLRAIQLIPLEWSQAVELTQHGSPYLGNVLDAAFDHASAVVVLLTPDDVAYLQPRYGDGDGDPDTQPAAQARPNVLFEAGMALGRSARQTVIVEIGSVRRFSDIAGRHTIRFVDDVASRQHLAQRLKTAGCPVVLTGTDWHTAGTFVVPGPPGDGLPLGRRVPSAGDSRPPLAFDLRYTNRGGNSIDKLQVINVGTETASNVRLSVPENAALSLQWVKPIEVIPSGRYVTLDVFNTGRLMSGAEVDDAFYVTILATSPTGEEFSQDVFIDVNG